MFRIIHFFDKLINLLLHESLPGLPNYPLLHEGLDFESDRRYVYPQPSRRLADREGSKLIGDLAKKEDNPATMKLAQEFMSEQIEEEDISRGALVIIEEEGNIFSKAERILDLLSKK